MNTQFRKDRCTGSRTIFYRLCGMGILFVTMLFAGSASAAIIASYDGSYAPDSLSPPPPNTQWSLFDNITGNNITPDPVTGVAAFLDNSYGGRVSIYDTLADTPIGDKEWSYEFTMSVQPGSQEEGGWPYRAYVDLGIRDEGAPAPNNRVVMLGFFNSQIRLVNNDTYPSSGVQVASLDVRDGVVRRYRVEKFNDGGQFKVQVYIDDVPQFTQPIAYDSLPSATGINQGFGYFSLTPGISSVLLDEFVLDEKDELIPPTADAGDNQSAHPGDTVLLDGTGSYDDQTATTDLTYFWAIVSKPAGSNAEIDTGSTGPGYAEMSVDEPGDYDISLVVQDEQGLYSEPAYVMVSSLNSPPIADAGENISVPVDGNAILLDGSASSDPDMDPITFSWELVSKPEGSNSLLVNPSSATPQITVDSVGSYIFELLVNDGFADSEPYELIVEAYNPVDELQSVMAEAMDIVQNMSPDDFFTKGGEKALTELLRKALEMAQAAGDLLSYQEILKLNDRVPVVQAYKFIEMAMSRSDGCVRDGIADVGNPTTDSDLIALKDYIVDCDQQLALYAHLVEAEVQLKFTVDLLINSFPDAATRDAARALIESRMQQIQNHP